MYQDRTKNIRAGIFLLMFVLIGIEGSFHITVAQGDVPVFVADLDWSPDGTILAVAVSTPADLPDCYYDTPNLYGVRLINTASGAVTATLMPKENCSMAAVDFNSMGTQLLTVGNVYAYYKWDVATAQELQGVGMFGGFLGGAWRPDNTEVLIITPTGIDIHGQDLISTRLTLLPVDLAGSRFTYAIWSPDGSAIASSTVDGRVYVWNSTTKTVLTTFQGHTQSVTRLAWHPSLNLIASGDESGVIRVWNAATGASVRQLSGHNGAIRDLTWRPDGQQLASAGADNTVRAWDWPSGQMHIVDNNRSSWAVAYKPDSGQLAYGGEFSDPVNLDVQTVLPPYTPPATPTPTTGFPTTGILDTFDRADGALGSGWSGGTGGYTIVSNRLDVGGGGDIYWNGTSFGADQEAYVTLTTIDPMSEEVDLLLKSQQSGSYGGGVIEVWYTPSGSKVQVWTFTTAQGWVQRGADIPATFAAGDRFGARAKADGTVEVYRNGTLLGARDVTAWPYYAGGGFIGLWFIGSAASVLDDFGGGTVSAGPTATPTLTATATRTPTATASATGSPQTLTLQVSLGSDDVNEVNTTYDASASTVWAGTGGSTTGSYLGLRFTGVTIPASATITGARLEVYSTQSQWISIGAAIRAQASDNATTFSSSSRPSGRVTGAQVVEHSSDVNWSANTWYTLQDGLAPVVQEVVSRPGWQSGNSLALILRGTSAGPWGRKFFRSFEGGGSEAARLVVTFQ